MSVYNFKGLVAHMGHSVDVACYGDDNAVIECSDCNEILVSFDKECQECGMEMDLGHCEKCEVENGN